MFNIPIVKLNSGYELTEDENLFVQQTLYKYVQANNNFLTENFYILNEPRLSRLKHYVEGGIKQFKENVCGIAQDLVITQSWIARTAVGGGHSRHNHPNSIFSGVVYLDCSDNSPLNFYHEHSLFKNFKFDVEYTHQTEYNSTRKQVQVSKGDLIMFPSWLEHDVDINPGPRERLVLSFNCFISGEMGCNNFYPTKLKIN